MSNKESKKDLVNIIIKSNKASRLFKYDEIKKNTINILENTTKLSKIDKKLALQNIISNIFNNYANKNSDRGLKIINLIITDLGKRINNLSISDLSLLIFIIDKADLFKNNTILGDIKTKFESRVDIIEYIDNTSKKNNGIPSSTTTSSTTTSSAIPPSILSSSATPPSVETTSTTTSSAKSPSIAPPSVETTSTTTSSAKSPSTAPPSGKSQENLNKKKQQALDDVNNILKKYNNVFTIIALDKNYDIYYYLNITNTSKNSTNMNENSTNTSKNSTNMNENSTNTSKNSTITNENSLYRLKMMKYNNIKNYLVYLRSIKNDLSKLYITILYDKLNNNTNTTNFSTFSKAYNKIFFNIKLNINVNNIPKNETQEIVKNNILTYFYGTVKNNITFNYINNSKNISYIVPQTTKSSILSQKKLNNNLENSNKKSKNDGINNKEKSTNTSAITQNLKTLNQNQKTNLSMLTLQVSNKTKTSSNLSSQKRKIYNNKLNNIATTIKKKKKV